MSYLGKVDMNDANIKHYSLTGSTLTVIPLTWVPVSEQSLRVTINGVVQQGGSFSLSGANLTLGGPLVVTDDLEVVGIQSVGNIITPADNSVTEAKLTSSIGARLGVEWQSVQTTGFTAVAGKGYPCDTTGSSFTVTLPAAASTGDLIALVDYAGTLGTNPLTLGANGLKIDGATDDKTLVTKRLSVYITYVDATQGWVATSGVNTSLGGALSPTPYSMDFLVIGGGGGGGAGQSINQTGGGGGAGGYRTSTQTSIIGNVITVTIGDGAAGTSTDSAPAVNGTATSIVGTGLTTISSAGGGGGAMYNSGTGGSGGSGGGGGSTAGTGGSGNTPSTSPVQGYAGGNASSGSGNSGGGGGGSSAVGTNASGTNAGDGGAGTASSITGGAVTRAGGGGGGAQGTGASAGTAGSGGGGIGGLSQQAGADGTVNTGSGGGGGANNAGGATSTTKGGNGGKGVVIISVPTSGYSGVTTGSPTVTTHLTKTIITFTGSGSYTE